MLRASVGRSSLVPLVYRSVRHGSSRIAPKQFVPAPGAPLRGTRAPGHRATIRGGGRTVRTATRAVGAGAAVRRIALSLGGGMCGLVAPLFHVERGDELLAAVQANEEGVLMVGSSESDEVVLSLFDEQVGFWNKLWKALKLGFRSIQLLVMFSPSIVTLPFAYALRQWFGVKQAQQFWVHLFRINASQAGPCWVKLVQWAATRPDLFGRKATQVLAKLHTGTPCHSIETTVRTIESAFDARLGDIFEEFDMTAIASGAVAQVHRGVLKSNGKTVAVKVRHPRVIETMSTDLALLRIAVNIISKIPKFGWLGLDDAVMNFAMSMRAQLDLTIEARNLVEFQKNFVGYDGVVFPTPYLAAPTVIVESFESGKTVEHYLSDEDTSSTELKHQIASIGFNVFMKMMVLDNLVHADLHPGNLIVRENDHGGAQLIVIDAGLTTRLSNRDRQNFLDLFSAVVRGDGKYGAQLMIERSPRQSYITDEDRERFVKEMDKLLSNAIDQPLNEIPIGAVLNTMIDLAHSCQVKLEGNFATLVAGIIVAEGIARQLNANFALLEEAGPLLLQDSEVVQTFLKAKFQRFMN